jgi:hypothetical protein
VKHNPFAPADIRILLGVCRPYYVFFSVHYLLLFQKSFFTPAPKSITLTPFSQQSLLFASIAIAIHLSNTFLRFLKIFSEDGLLPTILFLFFDRIVAFTIYDPFDQTQDMFTIVYWSKIRVFLCSFVVYIPRNLRPSAVKLFFEV